MHDLSVVKIGSRASLLAMRQAHLVRSELLLKNPELQIEIIKIKTLGDKILDSPLSQMEGKGFFVKEIEEALLDKKIDLAVHSMKDLPTEIPNDLQIGAVLKREDSSDVFVSQDIDALAKMPQGGKIFTSSLRRKVQVLAVRPDIEIIEIRGNVDTRLRKLSESDDVQGMILAAAGLLRLGLKGQIRERLEFIPAVGQGALGIEIRKGDEEISNLISVLNDKSTALEVLLERIFLKEIGGGCQTPSGANVFCKKNRFFMKAFIGSLDGKVIMKHNCDGFLSEGVKVVTEFSKEMLNLGGKKILEKK